MPKDKPKVCFVLPEIGGGGAERVIIMIASYFVDNGFDVQISAGMNYNQGYEIDERIKIVDFEENNLIKPFFYLKRIINMRKAVKDSDVVISFIFTFNVYTILSCLFMRKKIIVSDRGDLKTELKQFNNPIKKLLVKLILKFAYRFPYKIIFQTEDAQKYYPLYIRKNSVVIPNPITPSLPKRHEGQRRKEIVSICRLDAQKNIKMSIDAFELLLKDYPEFIFTIFGDGELRGELEAYIDNKRLSGKISMPGFEKNVHQRVLDSFMYVSSSNYEGISNSMLEALGIGLPTIVTDCPAGGARMFIKQYENGVLVPVGDVHALYKGMRQLVEDDELRNNISKNAIKIRDEISVDIVCKRWMELIL